MSMPSMGADTTYGHILLRKSEGVARITLNRPERMNAMGIGTGSSRDEIAHALADADADAEIGSVLIDAVGRAFCAGGDLSGARPDPTLYDDHRFGEQMLRFYAEVRGTRKPVIAAVNGLCLGAGLGFIAQCDIVVAADDARFGLIEGRIGLPGAAELVPVIGAAWAKFLIFTGEVVDVDRAVQMGLVLCKLPADRLGEQAFDLARRVARMPREALELNKVCVNNVFEAMGRGNARLAGRPMETMTKNHSAHAEAPDGRRFREVLAAEGMEGLKRARDLQYTQPWLDAWKR